MEEISSVVENYRRSVETLDRDLAQRVWADTPDVSFIHPRGHEHTWAEVWQNFYQNTMGLFSERALTVYEPRIYSNGDAAYVEFYWDFVARFKKDGSPHHTEGRESQMLLRTPLGWRIIHVHYSGKAVTGDREGF